MIDLTKVVLLFGGWSVVLVAITGYLFNRISERLSIQWKMSADQNTAKLQSELSKNNSILNSLISFQGSNHALMQARRLKAIEILWKAVNDYHEVMPDPGALLLNVLTVVKYEEYWADPSKSIEFKESIIGLDEDHFWIKSKPILDIVDLERPFIGEKIWELYNLYTGFILRVSHLFFQGVSNRKFYHWSKDDIVKHLLETSLSDEEIKYVYSNKFNSYKLTCSLIQSKILEEINKIVLGDTLAEDALKKVQRMDKILARDSNGAQNPTI